MINIVFWILLIVIFRYPILQLDVISFIWNKMKLAKYQFHYYTKFSVVTLTGLELTLQSKWALNMGIKQKSHTSLGLETKTGTDTQQQRHIHADCLTRRSKHYRHSEPRHPLLRHWQSTGQTATTTVMSYSR